MALRHDQLHGDLAFHVDVLERSGAGRAQVDERRRERAAGDLRGADRQRRFEDEVGRAGAEGRIG